MSCKTRLVRTTPLEHVGVGLMILQYSEVDDIVVKQELFVAAMCRQLEQMRKDRERQRAPAGGVGAPEDKAGGGAGPGARSYECVALHVSPDLGERIMLSGERGLLDEVRYHMIRTKFEVKPS